MKRVYLSVRSLLSAGASLILGWLGFSSCDSIGMAEYGTPTVEYEFKVRVTDQDTKPVEGLEISVAQGHQEDQELTDTKGEVELEGDYTGFYGDHKVMLLVKDIDGEKNGVVADKRVSVEVSESDFVRKGKGRWNEGKVEKHIDIQVERK